MWPSGDAVLRVGKKFPIKNCIVGYDHHDVCFAVDGYLSPGIRVCWDMNFEQRTIPIFGC